ncbi:ankyrin repeat-containing protein [Stagonosporopsis vannaccii]|nr:ankyrin repeat-containing protein [Stagonosporopsis vannaccii]
MHLINVRTRLREEFTSNALPEYAILSHTWEEEEVSYSQYSMGDYRHMKGYYKIDMTCRTAERTGVPYAWVDTCCIDKSSSADLSEAINSMYQWYEGAKVCYAYLSDWDSRGSGDWTETLPRCRWFTRGWTLQELIAPKHMIFFDSAWDTTTIIDRAPTKARLVRLLSDITRVDELLLHNHRSVHDQFYSVAQKMSWAARRETTRVEDKAYCLLGLLNINMPLLYGEGKRAFIRLQEEIMRSKADLSILAWQLPYAFESSIPNPGPRGAHRSTMLTGVLALSPDDFEHATDFTSVANRQVQEFSATNVGIKIRARLYLDAREHTLILPLYCALDESGNILSIRLLHVGNQHYLRLDPFSLYLHKLDTLIADQPLERYLLPDHFLASGSHKRWESLEQIKVWTRTSCLQILPFHHESHVYDPWPLEWYDRAEQAFFVDEDQSRDMCCVKKLISLPQGQKCAIILIATGWSDELSNPQFGIALTNLHESTISNVQDRACKFHYDRRAFLNDLKYNGVPRVMSLNITLPETNEVANVMAHPTRHPSDKRNYRDWGWSVTFSVAVNPSDTARGIRNLEWITDEDRTRE